MVENTLSTEAKGEFSRKAQLQASCLELLSPGLLDYFYERFAAFSDLLEVLVDRAGLEQHTLRLQM